MSLTTQLQDALLAAAGEGRDVAPVSFTIDFGTEVSEDFAVSARVERATRSLVFAIGEAQAEGRTIATASGVYRVL
jgi:acyl-coenzyme A thioesterase PaaI-like protein